MIPLSSHNTTVTPGSATSFKLIRLLTPYPLLSAIPMTVSHWKPHPLLSSPLTLLVSIWKWAHPLPLPLSSSTTSPPSPHRNGTLLAQLRFLPRSAPSSQTSPTTSLSLHQMDPSALPMGLLPGLFMAPAAAPKSQG